MQGGPKRNKEAVEWLGKALELEPEYTPAKFYLALACERTGDLACAKRLLEEVTFSQPKELKPHIALARIYYRLGEREKADRENVLTERLRAGQQQTTSSPPSLQ